MKLDLDGITDIDDRMDAVIKILKAARVADSDTDVNSQGGVHAYTLLLHFDDLTLRNELMRLLGGPASMRIESPYDIGSPFPGGY